MTRRRRIALLINDAGLGDHYQGALRRGVEQACRERNFDLWSYGGRMDSTAAGTAQRRILELVDPSRIDGVVFGAACIASYARVDDLLERVRRHEGLPLCAVGHMCQGMPSLVVDNIGGAARLIDHLVGEHGRRRIVYLAGPAGHEESEQRLVGTREALARYGLSLRPEALHHGNFSMGSAREIMDGIIRRDVRFDCVIAASDDMAAGTMDVLRERGYHCPGDVAIAGFDDAASARFNSPPLTTIRQPVARLGYLAVLRVVDAWNGRDENEVERLDTELVVRESCGCQSAALLRDLHRDLHHRQAGVGELLTPVVESEEQRTSWVVALQDAVESERSGESGAVFGAFTALLDSVAQANLSIEELQPVVTHLRSAALESGPNSGLEEAFHAVRVLIGRQAAQRAGDREFRSNWLLREMQTCSERLATCLTLAVLEQTLVDYLPRLGIYNALVSTFDPEDRTQLEVLVCIQGGVRVPAPTTPYRADLIVPPGLLDLNRRVSFTVLPLTFEADELGVVVLEIPLGLHLYALLREQIGNSLKSVQLYQEMVKQERLNAQVQEERRATAERLKSVSVIAGGVAHDLNNVLGPLVALPEIIRLDLQGRSVSAEILDDLDTIRDAGQRAAVTIRDLLMLGKLNEVPREALDLTALLRREARGLAVLCDSNPQVELVLAPSDHPIVVRASKPHVARAISNLVLNAVDAIDGKGTIVVRVVERRLDQRLSGVEPVDPGNYGVIEVEDTGAGIPPELLSRVLEPFFTAKRRPGIMGTGLGLAIVNRIVKEAQGTVQVESQIGRGTRFALYFPLHDVTEKLESVMPGAPDGGHERILVVDDEVVQLRTARRILVQLGYEVSTAQSGADALRIIDKEAVRPFDLLIVDMVMPELNGLQTIELARRSRPGLRALITSGYAPDEMDTLAKARGLCWLPKPYSRASLAAVIRSALQNLGD